MVIYLCQGDQAWSSPADTTQSSTTSAQGSTAQHNTQQSAVEAPQGDQAPGWANPADMWSWGGCPSVLVCLYVLLLGCVCLCVCVLVCPRNCVHLLVFVPVYVWVGRGGGKRA